LTDLLVVAAVAAVLFGLLLYVLSKTRVKTVHSSCISQIKQLGLACRIFANDHEDKFPWATPDALGGSSNWAFHPNVFRHFLVMSNELSIPKILHCTPDSKRVLQTIWASLSNGNISYFLSIDAKEGDSQSLLSGDHNLTGGTLSNGFLRTINSNSVLGWTAAIHVNAGNVGMADGSAQQVTSTNLTTQFFSGTQTVVRLVVP
jgi:hypothetical protein